MSPDSTKRNQKPGTPKFVAIYFSAQQNKDLGLVDRLKGQASAISGTASIKRVRRRGKNRMGKWNWFHGDLMRRNGARHQGMWTYSPQPVVMTARPRSIHRLEPSWLQRRSGRRQARSALAVQCRLGGKAVLRRESRSIGPLRDRRSPAVAWRCARASSSDIGRARLASARFARTYRGLAREHPELVPVCRWRWRGRRSPPLQRGC